jgi:hypothetical protein
VRSPDAGGQEPGRSTAMVEAWAADARKEVRWLAAEHKDCPPDLLRRLADDPEYPVRLRVARHHACPEDVLRRLAQDPHDAPRREVAGHPACPQDVLRALACDSDGRVRDAVAANPAAPPDVLVEVHARGHHRALAVNPSCPREILSDVLPRLATAGDEDDRAVAAAHPHSEPERLATLASDKSALVRAAVAGNPSTPRSALGLLAKDRGKRVQAALAANPAAHGIDRPARAKGQLTAAERADAILTGELTRDQVDELLEDTALAIRIVTAIRGAEHGVLDARAAVKALRRDEVMGTKNKGPNRLLERYLETRDERLLEVLFEGKFTDQLVRLLRTETLTMAQVERLFDMNLPLAAWIFAQSADLTEEHLRRLSTAPSYSIDQTHLPAGEQPDLAPGEFWADGFITCHPQALVALHPRTPADVLVKLRRARSKYVRATLVERPDPEALPGLAKDKDPYVRRAVAASPHATVDLLANLAADTDIDVRTAAFDNPKSPETARATAALLGVRREA